MKPVYGFKNGKLRFERVGQKYFYYNQEGEKAFVSSLMDQHLLGRFTTNGKMIRPNLVQAALKNGVKLVEVDFFSPLILESEDQLLQKTALNNYLTTGGTDLQSFLNQAFGGLPNETDNITDHYYRPAGVLGQIYDKTVKDPQRETSVIDRMRFEELTEINDDLEEDDDDDEFIEGNEIREDLQAEVSRSKERIAFMKNNLLDEDEHSSDEEVSDDDDDSDDDSDNEDGTYRYNLEKHPRRIRREDILTTPDLNDAAYNLMKYIDSIDHSETTRQANLKKSFPKGFEKANDSLFSEINETELQQRREKEEKELDLIDERADRRRNRFPPPKFSRFDLEDESDGQEKSNSDENNDKNVSSRREKDDEREIIDLDEEFKKILSQPKKDFIELDEIGDFPTQNWEDDYETRQLSPSEKIALFDHAWWLEKIRNERLEIEADPNQPKDFFDELLDNAWLNAPKTSDLSYEVLFENPNKNRVRIPKPRPTEQLLNAIEPRIYSKDRSSTSYKKAVQTWNVLLKNKYYPWQEKVQMSEHVAREWDEYHSYLKDKKAKNIKADRIFRSKFRPGPRLYEEEMEAAQGLFKKMNDHDLHEGFAVDGNDAEAEKLRQLQKELGLDEPVPEVTSTDATANEEVQAVEDEDSLFAEEQPGQSKK
jgi:hypothetical protein